MKMKDEHGLPYVEDVLRDHQFGRTRDDKHTSPYMLCTSKPVRPYFDAYQMLEFLRVNKLFVIRHAPLFSDAADIYDQVARALEKKWNVMLHLQMGTNELQWIFAYPRSEPVTHPAALSEKGYTLYDRYELDAMNPLPRSLATAKGWLTSTVL
jgi:hypothetical protein